ncbi:MAG TPA: transposase [Alcanivorax sp.]|nr:transposase [Alcanivorax sp.]MBT74916.1 transposase [Alcanivorax sp.]HAI33504.1 transposase [Alcanivorax sp.]HAI90074.1 transposase [Alcanivorax sp.]HBP92347.1 transposase [Alcanivorax sp.]|tara:strand:- start:1364 stop:2332 length:969 start_codon:yes stop_codon:yes gene_type:complete
MDEHDTSYKLLFSHDRMVRDLLTGFLPREWVAVLDLGSLQKMNGSYVTDDLRGRHGDAIWRVRWGEEWLYVYLLLEFQSSVDRFMALRIMVYTGLLHQDLIRRGELGAERRLPPVLPVVLYNGERRWRAPTEVRPLIQAPPEGLEGFQPNQAFLLIDEGVYASRPEEPLTNLVAALFRLEHHRSSEEVAALLQRLLKWLEGPEQAGLRRSYLVWLRRRLPRWFPGETFPEMHDLQEAYEMITNRFEEWKERQRLVGVRQGVEQGIEQGRLDGERALVLRLIQRRFGEVPPSVHKRLQSARQHQLETWADRVLDADSLDDIFG